MSPLVRKELRSLLPPWGLALVLAILPIWFVWPGEAGIWAGPPGYLVYAPFALGILLLSLTPFGQEKVNWGTFSILLAQPVSRAQIWRIKTLLLALALLLVFIAFFLSVWLRVDSVFDPAHIRAQSNRYSPELIRNLGKGQFVDRQNALVESLIFGGLGALAGFAGGLWTTLLFRQVSAAFWFTLQVPMGLGVITSQLMAGVSDFFAPVGVCAVLGLYSAASFVWARRLFRNVQDTQWTGGVVSLPKWRRAAARAEGGAGSRKRRAVPMLLSKELQSACVNLLLAGGLLLIHLVVLAIRRASADYLLTHSGMSMTLEAFPVLWLAMPLLVGSIAVAEERKLGTFESLSCLPVSRRLQFSVKLVVAVVLGTFLGGVVPLAIEGLGTWAGLHPNTSMAFGSDLLPAVKTVLVVAFGISVLSFYGSSLTRNTLQALGSSVLACVIGALLVEVAAHPPAIGDIQLWGPRLIAPILVPVILLVIVGLAYRNYWRLQLSAKAWWRNGLVLLVGLLGTTAVTSAVYHRFWEPWLPLEPHHQYWYRYQGDESGGAQSFAHGFRGVTAPKVQASFTRMAALLPDGRLWLRQRAVRWQTNGWGESFFLPRPFGHVHAGLVPGSNWCDVAVSEVGCFGIRADGSLWDLSRVQPGAKDSQAGLIRAGESQDWRKVSGSLNHYCGLKSDGTLWEWRYGVAPAGAAGGRQWSPVQVGMATNWITVASFMWANVAFKDDGTIWRWGRINPWPHNGPAKNETIKEPQQWLAFPGPQRPISVSFDGYGMAAVCADGSLWAPGYVPSLPPDEGATETSRRQMVREGDETDWTQVAAAGGTPGVAIKRDGSMWRWRTSWHSKTRHKSLEPLSDYYLWASVCSYGSACLALGRDGSLCQWGQPEAGFYFDRTGRDIRWLLLPTRLQAIEIADLAPR